MTVSVTTAEHSIEHAMSAFHQELPHGAESYYDFKSIL